MFDRPHGVGKMIELNDKEKISVGTFRNGYPHGEVETRYKNAENEDCVILGTTIFVLLLTRGLMQSLYASNLRNNVAILLFFAYSFFGGHVIDSVTSGSLFYYLLATMSSK